MSQDECARVREYIVHTDAHQHEHTIKKIQWEKHLLRILQHQR